MRSVVLPIHLDIDIVEEANHPMVRAYMSPDVQLEECHVRCILEAIEYANEVYYGRK